MEQGKSGRDDWPVGNRQNKKERRREKGQSMEGGGGVAKTKSGGGGEVHFKNKGHGGSHRSMKIVRRVRKGEGYKET